MTKKSPKKAEIEQAGRLLAFIYESGYLSYKRMLLLSFVRGVMSGIGGFIGATLVISLIIWLVSIFTDVPIVGPLFEQLRAALNSS